MTDNLTHVDNTTGNAIDVLQRILESFEKGDCIASIISIVTKDGAIVNTVTGTWRTQAFKLLVANEINKETLIKEIKDKMKVIVETNAEEA